MWIASAVPFVAGTAAVRGGVGVHATANATTAAVAKRVNNGERKQRLGFVLYGF